MIESLSDSTVYMAYYTVAHYLQSGPFNGSEKGSLDIEAEDMTHEVWDYVFKKGSYPKGTPIPEEKLAKMRHEFEYWYPMNMRVSGKDLIGNHLTFCLFNHMAIWGPEMMPKSMFTNGHVLMDNEKMSKSTGNFLTVEDGIKKYSADAVRIALANAGDTNEFSNFETDVANAAVLKLFQLEEWATVTMAKITDFRTDGETAADRIFAASLDYFIEETDKAMNAMCFRDALKLGFFDLLNTRDAYKNTSKVMRKDLIIRYLQVQAVLMAPIIPHMSEHLWTLSGGKGLCVDASWPAVTGAPKTDYFAGLFIQKFANDLFPAVTKNRQGKKAVEVNTVSVYVAPDYHDWQKGVLGILKTLYNHDSASFPPPDLKAKVKTEVDKLGLDKKLLGTAMGFGMYTVTNMTGPETFEETFPFAQMDILADFVDYFKETLKLTSVEIYDANKDCPDPKKQKGKALPGAPTFSLS